jgi:MFS family permease
MLCQFFSFAFAFTTFFSGFALFAERRFTHDGAPYGPTEVAYLFAFSGLIGVIIQGGGMGPLVRSFGEKRLVEIGFATMAAGFLLLGAVHRILFLLLAIALFTFGSAVLRPSLTALITSHVPRHRQGLVIGLMQSLMSVAQIIAPIVAGALIQTQLLSAWAFAGSIFCAVGLALVVAIK